jgi:hypothetical protein
MSRRHHHGPLVAQHTERVFGEPAFWAVYCLIALLILIGLAGCASTSVHCTNLERGACTVTSTRLLTDSGVNLTTPDGLALGFSSKPNEAGTAAAFKALGDTVGLLARVVASARAPGIPPTPGPVPPVPAPLPPFPSVAPTPPPEHSPLRAFLERRTLEALESPNS